VRGSLIWLSTNAVPDHQVARIAVDMVRVAARVELLHRNLPLHPLHLPSDTLRNIWAVIGNQRDLPVLDPQGNIRHPQWPLAPAIPVLSVCYDRNIMS